MIEYNGYQIKPHPTFPMQYVVATSGKGGKIPDILSGVFTSPSLVKSIIDAYLLIKPRKDVDDAETRNKG